MDKKETIKNAVSKAFREGYDQVVYMDDVFGGYAFSRDYPLNNMYKRENVIGHIRTGWQNGIFYAKYCEAN